MKMKKQSIAIIAATALLVGWGLSLALSRSGGSGSGLGEGECEGAGVSALVPSKLGVPPERFREAVDELVRGWRRDGWSSTRDSYPPRDREDEGLFTAEGLSDVFEDTVGMPTPHYLTPLAGTYSVSQYTRGDTDNFNATVYAFYAVEPEDVERLREDVLASWQERFAGKPVAVEENRLKAESGHEGLRFSPGSTNLFVYEEHPRSRMIKHSYGIRINPDTGLVYLISFRGMSE